MFDIHQNKGMLYSPTLTVSLHETTVSGGYCATYLDKKYKCKEILQYSHQISNKELSILNM